jgi:restriction endonuclease Mrr
MFRRKDTLQSIRLVAKEFRNSQEPWWVRGPIRAFFVTTSVFTKGAVEYANRVPQRIILVDGEELARLMVRYGVGVRTERAIEIKRLDADYFEPSAV